MTAPAKIFIAEREAKRFDFQIFSSDVPYIREDVVRELVEALNDALRAEGFDSFSQFVAWEAQARAALKKVEGL